MTTPVNHDLFERYPEGPGWKARQTSRAAASGVSQKVRPLRERVLAAIRAKPRTPEEVARILRAPVMNVRPRCSELAKLGLVEDSGERRKAQGGRKAIVWRARSEAKA